MKNKRFYLMVLVVLISAGILCLVYDYALKHNADLLVIIDIDHITPEGTLAVSLSSTVIDAHKGKIVDNNISHFVEQGLKTTCYNKQIDGILYNSFEIASLLKNKKITFSVGKLTSDMLSVYVNSDYNFVLVCSIFDKYRICDYSDENVLYKSDMIPGDYHLLIKNGD